MMMTGNGTGCISCQFFKINSVLKASPSSEQFNLLPLFSDSVKVANKGRIPHQN